MTDFIDLEARKERMKALFSKNNDSKNKALIYIKKINDDSMKKVKDAVIYYIWDCIISSDPKSDIKVDKDFLSKYEDNIKNLPNLTPNGLLVPKRENLLSFNKLQKVIFDEFYKNNLNEEIDKVQFPINLRIQSGEFDTGDRPRASTKKHTDIWAGDPSGAILVFLHVFGDFEKIGIEFFEPKKFPKSCLETISNYDKGNRKIDDLIKLDIKYNDSGWIFADPFLLHQTFKLSNSIRISLDFRLIPKVKLDSDSYEDENRKPYFISTDLWSKYGDSKILSTKQSMLGDYEKNNFTRSYPVEIFSEDILDNSKNNILSDIKFIGKNYIKEKFDLNDKDFEKIFGDTFEILEYKVIIGKQRDDVIKSVLEKINLKGLRVSGENNNEVWEKGWGEILDSIADNFHPDKLMPQYFDHHNIMRFDGEYIRAVSENFVYKYDQIIRKIILHQHIDTKKLIELGCGTGSGTMLAANLLDNDIELTASDWATKSQLIVDKISEYTKRQINSVQFNMLDLKGWDELNVDENSSIISFHALEQLGDNYKPLLNKLCEQKVKCIHLEPIYEYYDQENLYDELVKIYHKKRNYLGLYLTDIRKMQKDGKAKILKEQRISFGDRYHEAYSLLIWKGI